MNNFPVKVDGKEYWISRSNAVVGIVYKYDEEGNLYILANKRGKGCPDYVGYWNITCGYLDYNENITNAVSREVFEETGLVIPKEDWHLWYVNSSPDDEKQTVSFRFVVPYMDSYGGFTNEHSEPNEVDEIKWIKMNEIGNYNWAFSQKEVLKELEKSMERDSINWRIKNKLYVNVHVK